MQRYTRRDLGRGTSGGTVPFVDGLGVANAPVVALLGVTGFTVPDMATGWLPLATPVRAAVALGGVLGLLDAG